MHPNNKLIRKVSRPRQFVRSLALSALLGTVGASAAHAGEYTIHGSSCAFFSNSAPGISHVETGIFAESFSEVTCPLIRLDRQDNQLSLLEIDYRKGDSQGGHCRVFAISDLGEVAFGPAVELTAAAHENSWLMLFGDRGQTPVAQGAYSTYAVDCLLPQGSSIHGLVVQE